MDIETEDASACDDKATIKIVEHLRIRDGETGDDIVNQRIVDVNDIIAPSE